MNELLRYLLESGCCLAALYLVYGIFLSRDTFFVVNRIFLLSAVALSLIIPLIPYEWSPAGPLATFAILLEPVRVSPETGSLTLLFNLRWFELAGIVYLTGVVIFGIRLAVQVLQLYLLVRRTGISRQDGLNLVFVDQGYSPFSFFNLLFIRKEYAGDPRLSAIIEHERIHIRQLHTVDLFFLELLTIVHWFNPFAWLLQRSVKTVHEYLADEGVLRKGVAGNDYRRLLFGQALGMQVNNLTNNFNVSLIKKRMIMMTKSRSAKLAALKAVVALPVLISVVLFFSAGTVTSLSAQTQTETAQKQAQIKTQSAQNTNEPVYGTDPKLVPDHQPEYPGGFEALSQFIVKNFKYPESAIKKGTQGTVFISFIVNTNGSLSDIKVKEGIGDGCDEEALRVVGLMPDWKPGTMNDGKKVRVKFVLPIRFALDDKKK